MNLIYLTHLLNYDSNHHNIRIKLKAFHSLNHINLFIQEPITKSPFMLTCLNENILGTKLKLMNYKYKTPREFMDELFYNNKVHYYVLNTKRDALTYLFNSNNIHANLSADFNKFDNIYKIFYVTHMSQKYNLLLHQIYNFTHVYSLMVLHCRKYFNVLDSNKLTTDNIQNIKSKLKKNEFKYPVKLSSKIHQKKQ